jgi:hypothetical protein
MPPSKQNFSEQFLMGLRPTHKALKILMAQVFNLCSRTGKMPVPPSKEVSRQARRRIFAAACMKWPIPLKSA